MQTGFETHAVFAAIFLLSGVESPDPSGFCMTDNERPPVSETPATVTEAAEKKPRPRRTTQTRTARSARTTKTVKRAPTTRTRSTVTKAAPENEAPENDKISLADFMATVSSSDPKQETGLLAGDTDQEGSGHRGAQVHPVWGEICG